MVKTIRSRIPGSAIERLRDYFITSLLPNGQMSQDEEYVFALTGSIIPAQNLGVQNLIPPTTQSLYLNNFRTDYFDCSSGRGLQQMNPPVMASPRSEHLGCED
jgi:hypothetical protein